jgi:tol-pal system protein YbgF
MNRALSRFARAAIVAAPFLMWCSGVDAQDNRSQGGFLDNLFSRQSPSTPGGAAATDTPSESDLVVRLGRLENQLRQLTGAIEQLQFRNQQLELQLKHMQDDNEFRFQQLGAKAPPSADRRPASPALAPVQPSGRRSDVFDPSRSPNAPGVPRSLGGGAALPGAPPASGNDDIAVGAPGGRAAGAPLDLSTLARNAAVPLGGSAVAGPGRADGAADPKLATLPPSQTPKDAYDLAYGYVLRKDYALAEQSFQTFLKKYQADPLEPDVRYWLGESYFQRQRFQDAADAFLIVVRNFETAPKAPDALLRLGQSLAAMGQKELACASYGEIARRYPRASGGVRRAAEQEQKRAKC